MLFIPTFPFFLLLLSNKSQSSEARENGMGVSLFWRLSEAHPQAISALRCQVSLFEYHTYAYLSSISTSTYFLLS